MALPILPYREPEVHYSLKDLGTVFAKKGIKRVLVVTDQGLVKAGMCRLLEDELAQAGIAYTVYSEVEPNPTIDMVEQARRRFLEFRAEGFIALGGGSAMDCAKAAACRIARPKTDIRRLGGVLKVWVKLPMIVAVPTTAGTGSETTLAAIITDSATHHKYAIMDFPLIPKVAVLDYRLTLGLPPHITATTGMDALVHAVEAYIGRSTNNYTRRMSEEAVTLIHRYLYRAYQDGQDQEARQHMLRASFCAGNAFTRSYVGYIHCVAHSLGGQYGTPHGLANAVLMPIVLKEYGSAIHRRLARLARQTGVVEAGLSDQETSNRFIAWVEEMNAKMNIPSKIDAIREEDIPKMVVYAEAEGNPLYPVPTLWDKEQLTRIYYLAKA